MIKAENATLVDSLAIPSLEWTIEDFEYATYCEEGFIEVQIINNFLNASGGLSHAYNIVVEAGWSLDEANSIPRQHECLPLFDFKVSNIPVTVESPVDSSYIFNFSNFPVGTIGLVGLEDLDDDGQMDDLALGKTVRLRMSQSFLPECFYSTCISSQIPSQNLRLRIHYENSCGVPITKNQPLNVFKYGLGAQNNYDNLEGTYLDGDTISLRLVLTRQLLGFNLACPNQISELSLTLPSTLKLLPNAIPSIFGFPLDFSILEDTLKITGRFSIGYFDIPLLVVCEELSSSTMAACASAEDDIPLYDIAYHMKHFCYEECPISIPLFCGNTKSFTVNCLSPEQEGISGIFTSHFSATRTTLGWTDETLSEKVAHNTPNLRLDHALPYDTVLLRTEALVVGKVTPEDIKIIVAHHYLSGYDTAHFSFLKAQLFYKDAQSQQTLTCEMTYPDTFYYEKYNEMVFHIDELFQQNQCLAGFHVKDGDELILETEVVIHTRLPRGLNKIPHLLSKVDFAEAGEVFSCSFREANLSVASYHLDVQPYSFPSQTVGCDTIRINSGFAQGSGTFHNDDYFPYEFRPLIEVTSVVFESPNIIDYVPGSAKLVYAYREGNEPNGFFHIIRLPIADPDIQMEDSIQMEDGIQHIFHNDGSWPIGDYIREQSYYYIEFQALHTCFNTIVNNGFLATTYCKKYRYTDKPELQNTQGYKQGASISYTPLLASSFKSLQSEKVADTDIISWEIEKCHTSNTELLTDALPHNWIGFEAANNNIDIISVQETTVGSSQDFFEPAYYKNDLAQWIQIGDIEIETCRTFRVSAKWKNCIIDTIAMVSGYNCSSYPINPEEGYLPVNYICNYGIKKDTLILFPPDFKAEVTMLNPITCHGFEDASLQITATPALSNLQYHWQNNSDTIAILENLAAGSYTITVTSEQACEATTTIEITEPTELFTSASILSDYDGYPIECGGDQNGIAEAVATGGNTPYQFVWNNGTTTALNEQLSAGLAEVTITDGNGCEKIETLTLEEPPPIEINYTSTATTCADATDGTASVTTLGGAPPYTYEWNNGANTIGLSGLARGSYFLTITDANDCQEIIEIIVDSPPLLHSQLHTSNCCGGQTASASVTPLGGSAPFQINWSSGQIGENANLLSAGEYSVTILESNGCALVEAFVITEIEPLNITLNHLNHESISGLGDGSIEVSISGGDCDQSLAWFYEGQFFAEVEDLYHLEGGRYQLFVTAGNNCSHSMEFQVGTLVATPAIQALEYFNIFPNPTQDELQIEAQFSKQLKGKIILYNALGQIFYQKTLEQKLLNETLDVGSFPNGVYWLEWVMEEGRKIEKIVIQHH